MKTEQKLYLNNVKLFSPHMQGLVYYGSTNAIPLLVLLMFFSNNFSLKYKKKKTKILSKLTNIKKKK